MASKPKVLSPVHPNIGLELAYRRKLEAMIEEMHRSVIYWLKAAYNVNTPKMATDASPAMALRQIMCKLSRKWQKKFDEAAPELARYFALAASKRTDGALASILKKAGFAVSFKMTAKVNDVMQAAIGEQVALIKSIAQQYLGEVEGLIMRSVQAGRDLHTLSQELHSRFGVTRRRAAFIARDQNNKATAVITRVRQEEVGITEAIWMHSHAGKKPRPTHAAANGVTYNVAEGWFDPDPKVRKHIWPGELINCRCVSRAVVPGLQRPVVKQKYQLGLDASPTFIEAQHPRDPDGKFAKTSGGVTHPKEGTTTGSVWKIANELSNIKNAHATKKEVMEKAKEHGLNPATVATQYSLWSKFHGQSKPATSKVSKTESVAKPKTQMELNTEEAKKKGFETPLTWLETAGAGWGFKKKDVYNGIHYFKKGNDQISFNPTTHEWRLKQNGKLYGEGQSMEGLFDFLQDMDEDTQKKEEAAAHAAHEKAMAAAEQAKKDAEAKAAAIEAAKPKLPKLTEAMKIETPPAFKAAVKTLAQQAGFKYKIGNETYNYYIKPDGSKISINHKTMEWKLATPWESFKGGEGIGTLHEALEANLGKTASASVPNPSFSNPSSAPKQTFAGQGAYTFTAEGIPLPHALPSHCKSAIVKYTDGPYTEMNNILRLGLSNPHYQKSVDDLIASFNHAPPVQAAFKTRRGINFGDLEKMMQAAGIQSIEHLAHGHVIHDKGVASTSINKPWNKAVMLHINVPKGARAIYVNSISSHKGEDETLLPPTKMKVIKVENPGKGNGKVHVHVEMMI